MCPVWDGLQAVEIPGFTMPSDKWNPHAEIRHFQGLSAVCAEVCLWIHISHHGKITKTKNGANQAFKDFFFIIFFFLSGRGHCTETGGDNKFQSRGGNVWKAPEKPAKPGLKKCHF